MQRWPPSKWCANRWCCEPTPPAPTASKAIILIATGALYSSAAAAFHANLLFTRRCGGHHPAQGKSCQPCTQTPRRCRDLDRSCAYGPPSARQCTHQLLQGQHHAQFPVSGDACAVVVWRYGHGVPLKEHGRISIARPGQCPGLQHHMLAHGNGQRIARLQHLVLRRRCTGQPHPALGNAQHPRLTRLERQRPPGCQAPAPRCRAAVHRRLRAGLQWRNKGAGWHGRLLNERVV